MCNSMSRKDDPVFNVKFVELVESHPCLWNSTLPAYSKKEETQKAWQAVANETKDSVRNCRERWRTIRSSFLRSLKMSRTTSGRGKRKYYLSKYMQFLIPYTKTRPRNASSGHHLTRKTEQAPVPAPPMTCINSMPYPPATSNDETKDSNSSHIGIAEDDIVVSLQDELNQNNFLDQSRQSNQNHLQLVAIKTEPNINSTVVEQIRNSTSKANNHENSNNNSNISINSNKTSSGNSNSNSNNNGNGNGNCNSNFNGLSDANTTNGFVTEHQQQQHQQQQAVRTSSVVDLTEFAEWIKCKNEHQRHCLMPTCPDADQSFLNSLHPFLKEMSSKQNLRFRQKVVALIDAVLDNAD